jgi:fructokinase
MPRARWPEIDEAGVAHYHWYIEKTTVPGLELADARRALEPAPDALHVGTLGLAMEPIADSLAAVVAEVPESTFVMVDPNCRPTATPDFDRYQARMRRIIARADVVKGSDEDFAYLALAPSPEATAELLLSQGVGAVLVTQGADVARGFCAGGEVSVPVPSVQVVDTVGAGDTFGGAFLGYWLENGFGRRELDDDDLLEAAVAFAVQAAAINCTRAGAEPPTREEMGLD